MNSFGGFRITLVFVILTIAVGAAYAENATSELGTIRHLAAKMHDGMHRLTEKVASDIDTIFELLKKRHGDIQRLTTELKTLGEERDRLEKEVRDGKKSTDKDIADLQGRVKELEKKSEEKAKMITKLRVDVNVMLDGITKIINENKDSIEKKVAELDRVLGEKLKAVKNESLEEQIRVNDLFDKIMTDLNLLKKAVEANKKESVASLKEHRDKVNDRINALDKKCEELINSVKSDMDKAIKALDAKMSKEITKKLDEQAKEEQEEMNRLFEKEAEVRQNDVDTLDKKYEAITDNITAEEQENFAMLNEKIKAQILDGQVMDDLLNNSLRLLDDKQNKDHRQLDDHDALLRNLQLSINWLMTHVTSECKKGWKRFGRTCYKVMRCRKMRGDRKVTKPCSGERGVQLCKEKGAWLASINSFLENEFVFHLVRRRQYIWLGGNDKEEEGNWVWADGRPLTYKNWAPYQPTPGEQNQDCMVMKSDKMWRDKQCNVNFKHRGAFVCEKRLSSMIDKIQANKN